ncbi:hypothetical protein [Oceanisphaera avium]|uniref:Uncharacterized protein n=1 Tax=Oceanisphaera avium TaxID=1903694 RepID=A0A1Y0CVK6_9GAMM|nr:hypothetical protein [Oceanisphaera avium]ART79054.1 hypothetical protein CBP12_01890 [Oceanisphaera avium]
MFIFKVQGIDGGQAEIRIQALDWSEQGSTQFSCDNDELAVILLSQCRSGSGFFDLLAGTRPMYVEQWLEYLQEAKRISKVEVNIYSPLEEGYAQLCGLDSEQIKTLLNLVYQVGGFNRLQIMRYLKHRHSPASMSTHYNADELTRYRYLGQLINQLIRFKSPTP